MIRGITYDKQLFKSNDFALMTNKFFSNNDGKVNGCNLSTSGNTIIMDTGWFIASGYYTNISTQEVIEATQSGTLVYEIDLSKTNTIQSFNQGSFKIITGTARQDDLFNNGTIYQLPIAEITIDGTNTTITKTLWDDIKGEAITEEEVDEKLADYDTSAEVDNKLANYKLNGDYAVVKGSLTLSNGQASTNIAYPTGFNYQNCVVTSFMAHNKTSQTEELTYGFHPSSVGYVNGAIGHSVKLSTSNINLQICNPSSPSSGTASFNYQIVLMKMDF